MEKDDLKELLRMDVPDVEIDTKKILALCEEKRNPFIKRKLSFALSSLLILLIVVGTTLISLRLNNVENINDKINNLSTINDNEQRMFEIMLTDKEILKLTGLEKRMVNLESFDNEKSNTSHLLKTSVGLNQYMNQEVDYINLNEIYDYNNIDEYRVLGIDDDANTYYQYIPNIKKFNSEFISMINIPYIDMDLNYDRCYILEKLDEYDNYDNDKDSIYILGIDNDLNYIQYVIHPSGFVIIEEIEIKNYGHQTINRYISLIRINYDDLYEFCMDNKTKEEPQVIFGSVPSLKVNNVFCENYSIKLQWLLENNSFRLCDLAMTVDSIPEKFPNLQVFNNLPTFDLEFELPSDSLHISYFYLDDSNKVIMTNKGAYSVAERYELVSIYPTEKGKYKYNLDLSDLELENNILVSIDAAYIGEYNTNFVANYYFIIYK